MEMRLVVAQGTYQTIWERQTTVVLGTMFTWDTEKSSYCHLQEDAQASVMVPLCSSDLSISCWKLFCSWQFIRFSSPSLGWAIIKPHQAWRGNHSWAFFSHGVLSQWQAHWLCSHWVRLSPVLRRDTREQIETGGDRGRVRHVRLVRL